MKKFISVLTILCLLLGFSMPIVSAANSWSGWALSGGAVLQGDEIHVISNNASTSIARLNRTAGTKFDLEVEFTVKKFGTQGGFQILTGSNRAMMYIYENRIEYRASNFSATNKLSSISYDIGYTKHKYRIVGNGNQCDLYIDDYFVTDFTIENNTGSSCIYFWTMSAANSTSEIVVEGYRDRGASTQTSSTATDEKTFDTEPKAFRYDFEDGEDISAWQLGGAWEVKDGYLQCRNSTTSSHLAKRVTAFADDYVLEMRVRYPEYGMNSGINLRDGVHELLAHPYEKLLQVRNRLGIVAKTGLSLGNDWHDIKIETYNNGSDVMIFMDGELIHDNTTSDRVEEETYIGVSVTGTDGDTGWMQIDWMTFEPISNSDFGIKTPMQFAEYLEGQEVNLSTNVKDTDNVPYVEYKMNGKTVAKGEAPGYDAVLKNLKQGNYTITAEYGETKSVGVNFKVLPAVLGEIDVDNGKSVSIDLYDERSSVKSVECFADGMSIGTSDKAPFKFDLPELSAEAHMLSAVMYGDDGSIICETAEKMTVLPTETSASVNYANDIVYTLTGTDGSADVDFCNGNHRLHLSHSNGVVTYLTDEGEATYDGGVGVWRVLTDAYTAEVYRDGQFIFSFVMPKTDDVGCYTEENGLSISDLNISVPESRGNYFVKRNVKDINATYNLSNIGYYNNIDFVAGSGDGVELALSDGYFRTSIELKDGKIYTFTTDTDSSVPYRTEIADVSDFDGDVYYRVETAAGMTRLYADGKWLNSFRSVHSTGNGSVGVNVTDGDGLKYVSVNDNADLYVYEDNFTGSGEFDSEDYWRQENLVCYVDKTGGAMTLNAKNETKAISELHVSAQESEMSAEVEVKECTGIVCERQ